MWQFISQNWWILLFIGMMFFMHRPGGAGCCGGGHQHGQGRNGQDQDHVHNHDPEHDPASQREDMGGTLDSSRISLEKGGPGGHSGHHHGQLQSTNAPLAHENKVYL